MRSIVCAFIVVAFPGETHNLVIEWADLHRAELIDDWDRARAGSDLRPIEPLE